jgi:hypothetical protein
MRFFFKVYEVFFIFFFIFILMFSDAKMVKKNRLQEWSLIFQLPKMAEEAVVVIHDMFSF